MWLAICVPAISQVLAAHRAATERPIDAAFCTVDGKTQSVVLLSRSQTTDDASGTAHHDSANHAAHTTHADQGDVCGYCSLLANHPPLTLPALTGALSFAWIARAGPAVVVTPSASRLAFAPPARAPPVLS
ncbi:hypothetical protein AT302_21025 [Pandoraea norimbergensis]|uniref:DUF2946 domain-containing protein n=2 Tax=Pandoraea norimbergensis TaxID=93219 RepID=A0ABN4JMI9_9BURK|nr:hypothetical protein AT302_21025 [Pandoraea norimbergensis]